jgi:hypothetical protein
VRESGCEVPYPVLCFGQAKTDSGRKIILSGWHRGGGSIPLLGIQLKRWEREFRKPNDSVGRTRFPLLPKQLNYVFFFGSPLGTIHFNDLGDGLRAAYLCWVTNWVRGDCGALSRNFRRDVDCNSWRQNR